MLSGGASLGAVQVGMLHALYERSIVPDLIVGTSAGAINGAFIASRPQTVAIADALAALWGGPDLPAQPAPGVLGLLGTQKHLIGDGGLRRLIGPHLQCSTLEETPIPLHVIAVDVLSRDEVRLSTGRPATPAPSTRRREDRWRWRCARSARSRTVA